MRIFARILTLLVGISLALAAGAFAVYYIYPQAPDAYSDSADHVNLSKKGIYHILLAGLDEDKENTDTLLLIQFHAESKDVRILSIPRDTMSHVFDRENMKINAAYNVVQPPDIHRTIEEVEMLTSLKIDRHMITSFKAVEDVVDALGGIDINVPQDMSYEDPYQDLVINIKAGDQVLDGEESVHFLRFRSGYLQGDLGRVKAQQLFFEAFFDTLLKPSNIPKIPELIRILDKETESDMSLSEMAWFAKQSRGITKDQLKLFILPGRAEYVNDISYYIPAQGNLLAMLNKEFNPLDKRILPEDLSLVPLSLEIIPDTGYGTENTGLSDGDFLFDPFTGLPMEEEHRIPLYPNEPEAGPSTGAYYGYPGAYIPPPEQNTGQDSRGHTIEYIPAPQPTPEPEPEPGPPIAQPIDPAPA